MSKDFRGAKSVADLLTELQTDSRHFFTESAHLQREFLRGFSRHIMPRRWRFRQRCMYHRHANANLITRQREKGPKRIRSDRAATETHCI